MVLLLISFGAY
ncbi:hypothetical protein LMC31_25925 [Escherichia coli]|nr:hypothetical protein [Escherichia coli]